MAEARNSKFIAVRKNCDDANDSSSVSVDTSVNEESVDSDCNERCVVSDGKRTSPLYTCDDSSSRVSGVRSDGPISVIGENMLAKEPKKKLDANNGDSRPLFSVTFRDGKIARKYRKKVKEYFKALIKENDPGEPDCSESDLELDIWEGDSERSERSPEEDEEEEDSVRDDLFTVDTTPAVEDTLDVPTYDKKFAVLTTAGKKTTQVSLSMCFNCLGDHNLRDCTKPRDPSAISRNRKEFMNRHGGYPRMSRYHLEDDQRFGHFIPGHLSSSLTKALGLAENQLPKFIYRMRLLGYPPGWLEDAKVSHSGITLFDSQGQEVADPEDEEGEIISTESRDKYDISKIVSYPGFNEPIQSGIRDESRFYHCPPISETHSKEQMISNLQSRETRAYKRKKLIAAKRIGPSEVLVAHSDMEVEETEEPLSILADDNCRFIPPLPKDTPPRPPPPPSTTESDSEGGECRSQEPGSPVSTGQSSFSSPRAQSPSLSDLEAQKRQLLAELEDGGSSSDNQKNSNSTPSTPTLGRIKSVSLGTPILKSASPYARLPAPEKFSKNICDVINFENLPDSTGKYEQMSGLIKKVRVSVSRLQNE